MKALVVEREKLKNNLKIIRQMIENSDKKTEIIAVVKGNGYGLGLVEYVKFLIDNGIEFFAVATLEEALELRNSGIKEDILMMSSTSIEEEIQILIENNIIVTIGSKEAGEKVDEIAQKLEKTVRTHLKIDTGFGRYGFISSNTNEIVEHAKKWENIKIEGTFSHLSIAFYGDGQASQEQYQKFMKCVENLRENGVDTGKLHICNSSAFLRFPEMHLDAVRLGSVLLGRLSIPNIYGFKKVGYLKSNVTEIKNVPKGYNIGYSNSYITKKETKIALIPCGYADGFNIKVDRDMFRTIDKLRYIVRDIKDSTKKQQLYVEINGQKCKILGRLGMYHVTADVSGKDISINDEAIFQVSPMLVDSKIKREYI